MRRQQRGGRVWRARACVPQAIRQPEHQQGRRGRVESQLSQRLSVQVQRRGPQLVLQLTNHGIGGGPGHSRQDKRGGRGQQSPLRDTRQRLEWPPSPARTAASHQLTSRLGKTLSCLFPKAPPYRVKSSKLIWRTQQNLSAPAGETRSADQTTTQTDLRHVEKAGVIRARSLFNRHIY